MDNSELLQNKEILYFFTFVRFILLKMKKIALLTGGDSGEYEVSIKTADNIYHVLDKSLFDAYLIHIKGNDWNYRADDGREYEIDKNDFTLTIQGEKISFDAVFIAIHGSPGENGKLQAYFEMLGMPYTGCDMFCSALTFNKYFCNVAAAHFGIPVPDSVRFQEHEQIDREKISRTCGFPCFVKPCNSGSSVGVSKVRNETELTAAIEEAFLYDNEIMVEKFIPGKEYTCGITRRDGKIRPLAVTEVISKNEYYDYEAKYTPGHLELVTPADIDTKLEKEIFKYSEIIFDKLGCKGVVRIDYRVTPEGSPYLLEINTIPGQTAMSIIPRQIEYCGMDLQNFYSELILESLK